MDTIIIPTPSFLDELTPAGGDSKTGFYYHLAGVKWYGERAHGQDNLWGSSNEPRRLLRIRYQEKKGYCWQSSFQLSAQVWADKHDFALNLEDACMQAIACELPQVLLDYLGVYTVWYETAPDHWMAALNDRDQAHAWKSGEHILWWRDWAEGETVLGLLENRRFAGQAATLAEAMRAAIDAPDHFKRACAAMISTLTQPCPNQG